MPPPQPSVSQKRLAANRTSAAQSIGPRTPQGKARSAKNARRHGFTDSTFAVVRLKDLDEVAHLKTGLLAVYQPVNSQELFAIERLALSQQALLRAARLETGIFPTCLNEALDPAGNLVPDHPLPGPVGTPLSPRGRGVRPAQSPAARITKRSHSDPQPEAKGVT